MTGRSRQAKQRGLTGEVQPCPAERASSPTLKSRARASPRTGLRRSLLSGVAVVAGAAALAVGEEGGERASLSSFVCLAGWF